MPVAEQPVERTFDPLLIARLRALCRILPAVVVAVAVLVLLGWAANIEVLRSVVPGLTAMNPGGTALAFLLAGAALCCLTEETPSVGLLRAARILACMVIALTALRLVLYMVGLEWGPDQWLFRAKLDQYQPPNRMAPNTALGLLLIGVAMLMLDFERPSGIRPAQWLALSAALLSMLTLVGYAAHASALIGVRTFVPMALNSAVTLALLACGVLLARPDQGLMAMVSCRESGGVMVRRLLPASILAPAAFAGLATLGQQYGWFDSGFGVSLYVVATIVLFATLICWNAISLNRIDAGRFRAQKELDRSNSILKNVLHSMGDGVVVADKEGRFLLFNPVAERILGLGAIDAPPSEWTDQYGLFSPETGEPLPLDDIPLVKAIRGQQTTQQELLIKNPHLPDTVRISATARPLSGADGIEGGVVVFQDTTQRYRAAEIIRKARDEADAANRAKSEFLANMSHEIRTPMNAVIGMTELVLDTELNDMQRDYLKIVKDSAESLLSLINDILDFSKIEAGKLELDQTQFQLRDLLGDTMKTLSVRARGKELELACHVAPDVPESLLGDPHRLRQVITNLVGNALKFTERGEVVLDVSVDQEPRPDATSNPAEAIPETETTRIHFAVRDTGIGIPTNKLHVLFNAFSQVDASTTRRYGGTGLGLAITARLVPLMHGRVWVESEPGHGSTFHFTAEFDIDPSPPPPPSPPEALHGLRVLIVDDNATNRLILCEMLAVWGMRPECLASASAALDELHRAAKQGDPFKMVLSDVHMPDVDGFELTSRIRQEGEFDGTVIMMLSSGSGPGDVSRCRELGAASHLIKPIKASELYNAIAAALGRLEHKAAADVGTGPEATAVRDLGSDANASPLSILLAEDSKANQQLASAVLGKWGHRLTIAQNGLEAVQEYTADTYDVILMDVQMPEMDGLQATASIREIEQRQGGHIPIIALTAHAMKGDREEFLAAGMDDYLTKPIRWPELRRILNAIPRPASSTEAAIAVAQPTSTNDNQLKHEDQLPMSNPSEWKLDWKEALQAVDGSTELLHEILGQLVLEWPKVLADLRQAGATGDQVALKRAAHTIRGTLRFFGPTEAANLAQKIESLAHTGQVEQAASHSPELESQVQIVLDEVQSWMNSRLL